MLTSAFLDSLQIHGSEGLGLESFSIGTPAPREVIDARPLDHGATDSTEFYGPRTFELVGVLTAASKAALWAALDDLKAGMALGSTHVLKFRREGLAFDERAIVRVSSPVDVPLGRMPSPMLKFGVSLLAPDPRIYADTASSGSYDPTDAGTGGLAFPLDFPLDFNADQTTAHLTVVNSGTFATPPTLTVTGPIVNPVIDNDTTAESIHTQNLTLTSGAQLVIDVATRSVTLDGTARPDLVDVSLTTWFALAPSTNKLRLRGTGMSAGTTELAVAWRDARI